MKLQKSLLNIQQELKIGKNIKKQGLRYSYRTAEQVLEALKPLLKKEGCTVIIKEEYLDNGIIISEAIISNGDEWESATAMVGVDLEQKGMSMPQRFGSASSYAKKYALGNLFMIDDTDDSDALAGALAEATTQESAKKPITKEALQKAIKYVSGGGNINSVRKKYSLTVNELKQLKDCMPK